MLLLGVWALVTPSPDVSLQSGGVQGYTHSNYRVILTIRDENGRGLLRTVIFSMQLGPLIPDPCHVSTVQCNYSEDGELVCVLFNTKGGPRLATLREPTDISIYLSVFEICPFKFHAIRGKGRQISTYF